MSWSIITHCLVSRCQAYCWELLFVTSLIPSHIFMGNYWVLIVGVGWGVLSCYYLLEVPWVVKVEVRFNPECATFQRLPLSPKSVSRKVLNAWLDHLPKPRISGRRASFCGHQIVWWWLWPSFLSCSGYLSFYLGRWQDGGVWGVKRSSWYAQIYLEKHPPQHHVGILSWPESRLTVNPVCWWCQLRSTPAFICLRGPSEGHFIPPAFPVGPYRVRKDWGIGSLWRTLSPSLFPVTDKRRHLACCIDAITNRIKYQRICLKAWRKMTLNDISLFPTSFHTWQSIAIHLIFN